MTPETQVGDWIQAVGLVEETLPDGHVHIHAVKGGIGHVTAVDGDWATVYWERSGTTTDTHISEFKRLCGSLAGRFPITDHGSAERRVTLRVALTSPDDESGEQSCVPPSRRRPV